MENVQSAKGIRRHLDNGLYAASIITDHRQPTDLASNKIDCIVANKHGLLEMAQVLCTEKNGERRENDRPG